MNDYRVLVTGSRWWSDRATVYGWLDYHAQQGHALGHDRMVVIHGGAIGADMMAQGWCDGGGAGLIKVAFRIYRPRYSEYPRRVAPLKRNQEMVDAGADVCLAFHLNKSKGTQDCIDRAIKAGIPVAICQMGDQ